MLLQSQVADEAHAAQIAVELNAEEELVLGLGAIPMKAWLELILSVLTFRESVGSGRRGTWSHWMC